MKFKLIESTSNNIDEEIQRHRSNSWGDTPDLTDSQTKFFEERYKYFAYPVYHVGSATDDFSDTGDGIWFASTFECAHGSVSLDKGNLHECVIGFNNPYEVDCNYFDFDSIPLNTEALKFFGLYQPEFGSRYDYIPDESDFYDEGDNIKDELRGTTYTVSSDHLAEMIFNKGYDCAILVNINELFYHYPSDNTDYVVKSGNQIKSLSNLNPTDSHKFIETLQETEDD